MGGSGTPTTTTQNVIQQTQLPEWYQSYLQNVMGRAATQADSSQAPPPTQGIAGLTQDQLDAYQKVRDIQNGATSYYNQAGGDFNKAQGINFQGATAPGMQNINFQDAASAGMQPVDFAGASMRGAGDISSGIAQMQQAGNTNTASAAYPYATQGVGYLNNSAGSSALGSANPYIQASTQPTGLQAASPFLGAASQSASGLVNQYLNPYTQDVTDQIARLGTRNLTENILPGVSSDFIKAGQYGSGQMGTIGERAIRDTQQSILDAQTNSLQAGYGQALSAAQTDLARQAGLAGTAGGLGTAQQQALLGAGQATGQLSSTDLARLQAAGVDISQIGLGISSAQAADAARQLAAGQSIGQLGLGQGQLGLSAAQDQGSYNIAQGQLGLGAANAQGQYGLGQGQLGLGAANAQSASLLGAGNAQQNLGTTGQDQSLKMAAAQESAGSAQQGQQQSNLNAQFAQMLAQYNLPWDTISKLSGVIQGLPVGGTTSGTTQTQAPGPTTAGQVAGIGLGVAGLANSGLFKASGGPVRKPRENYSYGHTPKRGIDITGIAA